MEWANTVAGFIVGLLVGLTGVGGGALMTPILVLLLGVAPQTAVGTDLLYAAITKSFGSWVHGSKGAIDWVVLRRLASGSIPAALLTLWLLSTHKPDPELQHLIMRGLGLALALTSLSVLFRTQLHRLGQHLRTEKPIEFKRYQGALTVLAGLILGVLVTLTSVGAGALGVVMLVYLYPYRLTPTRLVATDIAHAIPLTLIAGLGHSAIGSIDWPLLGMLLLGSVPGVIIGSHASHRIDGKWVRQLLAVILLMTGGKLLLV